MKVYFFSFPPLTEKNVGFFVVVFFTGEEKEKWLVEFENILAWKPAKSMLDFEKKNYLQEHTNKRNICSHGYVHGRSWPTINKRSGMHHHHLIRGKWRERKRRTNQKLVHEYEPRSKVGLEKSFLFSLTVLVAFFITKVQSRDLTKKKKKKHKKTCSRMKEFVNVQWAGF